jgi:hypothetical protein
MLLILEGQSSYQTNTKLQVIGWGRQDINAEKISDELQRGNVVYFNNEYCRYDTDFTDDMICAKGYNQSGPCKGDSGGPLILPGNTSKTDLQLGILSFAPVECTHRKFTIQQRTKYYIVLHFNTKESHHVLFRKHCMQPITLEYLQFIRGFEKRFARIL